MLDPRGRQWTSVAVCSSTLWSIRMQLSPGNLDTICMATKPWRRCLTAQHEPSCWFTACCSALEDRKGIIRGDNLSTLERCSVSCFLSFVLHHGCFSQILGTNGQIQWCYSLLVMLESQPNISFCVRDLIVFVCQSHQINCGVEWRTEPRPPSPSPLSVPPASHISELSHFYLPLLSYPLLLHQFHLSSASFWLLPQALWSRESYIVSQEPSPWSAVTVFTFGIPPCLPFRYLSLQYNGLWKGFNFPPPVLHSPSPPLSWFSLWPSVSCFVPPSHPLEFALIVRIFSP